MVKIDLACGDRKKEGFKGVDIVSLPGVDIVHDLNVYPWPFEDSSVDEINCEHFVEHLTGSEIIAFMEEVYRILKPGNKITIICPYYSSIRAMQDPTHKSFISENTFLYYNKGWRDQSKLTHYPIKCDFDFGLGYNITNPRWAMASDEARTFAIAHYNNVVDDIIVTLTKRG